MIFLFFEEEPVVFLPELLIIGSIFGGFFYALLHKKSVSPNACLWYIWYLFKSFRFYTLLTLWNFIYFRRRIFSDSLLSEEGGFFVNAFNDFQAPEVWFEKLALEQEANLYLFNHTLQINLGVYYWKFLLLFIFFCCLGLLYINLVQNNFYILELPFFFGLLFWIFNLCLYCYNFFFVFLLMELITTIVIVMSVLYLIFISPKTVRVMLQFFVLNLVISTFYLFGVCLLLFLLFPLQQYSLIFSSFYISFDVIIATFADLGPIVVYCKFIVLFWIMTFLFKITIAPFSVWVMNIYSQLPILILLILMTVYKIVYFYLFLKLFFYCISLVPLFQFFWAQVSFLFVLPSMFIGCLAYREQDLKTILAYTTVSQMGYVLSGCISFNAEAIKFSLYYLVVYCVHLIALFTILLILQEKYHFTNLNQLYLLRYYNKTYWYLLIIIFFSFAGVPPFSGFFLKYFLFLHVYNAGLFMVALCGILSGFCMALIYLQVIFQIVWVKDIHGETLLVELTKKPVFYKGRLYALPRVVRVFNWFLWAFGFINFFFLGFFIGGYIFCEGLLLAFIM
jgi:NADH-quinone oxidoreductase subunit N